MGAEWGALAAGTPGPGAVAGAASEWRLISAAAGPALCELHVEQQAGAEQAKGVGWKQLFK